jgi:hypothetical protein
MDLNGENIQIFKKNWFLVSAFLYEELRGQEHGSVHHLDKSELWHL